MSRAVRSEIAMNLELTRLGFFVGAALTVALNSSCASNIGITPNETGGSANGGANAGATAGGVTGNAVPVSVAPLFDVAVAPCALGYAHPNICCQGAPYRATVCNEDLTRPFGVCETGQYAYPDRNACCSLDNRTACVPPSGVDLTPDAGQQSGCQNPCYPGAYPPPELANSADGGPAGSALCYFGTGMSFEPPQVLCLECPPTDWCSTPCPAGWSAPVGGQVDFCCQTDSSGQSFCFSQAGYIGGNIGGGGMGTGADCISDWFANDGNSYVARCDSTASPACACLVNGVATWTGPDLDCFDPSACGFPG